MNPPPVPPAAVESVSPARTGGWAFFWLALGLLLSVVLVSPLVQDPKQYHIDWLETLSYVHGTAARFGTDILFTYGPWGFAWGGYFPTTFALTCTVWLVYAVLMWLVAWRTFSCARTGRRAAWAAAVAGWALLLGGTNSCYADARWFLLPFALIAHYFCVRRDPADWLNLCLAAAIGFAGDVKFTYLAAGGIAVAAVTLDQLLARRRAVWPLLACAAVFLLAWVAGGQAIGTVGVYIRSSLEVVRGYPEAMNLGNPVEATESTAFGLIFATLVAASVLGARQPRGWLAPATLAVLGLVLFRAAYIRHDEHAVIASGLLCAATPLFVAARWDALGWVGRGIGAFGMAGALALQAYNGDTYEPLAVPYSPLRAAFAVGDFCDQLARVAAGKSTAPAEAYQEWMIGLRAHDALPPLQGTVDLVPMQTTLLLAYGYHYDPRPTLQSYCAYTPALARANADKYAGPHRPDHVLFTADAIDGRLPALEDNLLWLELLRRYQTQSVHGVFLNLVPRATPRALTLTPIGEATVLLGQAADVPPPPHGGLVWAKIAVDHSALAGLAAQCYKPAALGMDVVLAEGGSARHRFLAANGAEGFLLGPCVEDTATFAALVRTPRVTDAVRPLMPRHVTIAGAPGVWASLYFRPPVRMQFFEITLKD